MTELATPILECRGIRKAYPGVSALDGVDLVVLPGEVHALVGENGAGKSTLVKIIAGQETPDGGTVAVDGQAVGVFSPQEARRRGVTMAPQHPDLFPTLTALENLFVGDWPRAGRGLVSWPQMRARAEEVLARIDVSIPLDAPVSALSVAERQLLQIARALLADARLIILDEPTAALGREETQLLFSLIRRLSEAGVAIIYISHRLAEVFELARTVTVLRDGRLVGTRPVSEVTREALVGMMIGADSTGFEALPTTTASPAPRPPLLEVDRLTIPGRFEDITFRVGAGEIVGIAGVEGSGRSDVMRCLAGAVGRQEGSIRLGEQPVSIPDPGAASRLGIRFVPADRHQEALVLPMSVAQNITLGSLPQFARLGLISRSQETSAAARLAEQLRVRAASIDQPTASLSGGNQQKVALASRLAGGPQLLLLEEPTQGVDVGARAEIHSLIRRLAQDGVGVLLISSDLPELLSLSDRVLVMHRGRLVGELPREAATQERVVDLALGTGEHTVSRREAETRRVPVREFGLAVVLLAYVLLVCLRAPAFAGAQNIMDMLVNNSHLLIVAVGMTMVVITAGIDISVGSGLAVCATVAGAAAAAGWPSMLVLLTAAVTGTALGLANAGLIVLARVPPIITTLATLTLFRNVLIHFTGGRWISLPQGFRDFGLGNVLGLPVAVWMALLTALAGYALLRWTVLGRSIYATGSNPAAAAHQGVRTAPVTASVYVLMGLLVGVAAFAYITRWSAVQTNAGIGLEMMVITAVVVGGTSIFGGAGSIAGTVIGIALLGVISGSLTPLRIDPTWDKAAQGAIILAAVVIDSLRANSGSRARRSRP